MAAIILNIYGEAMIDPYSHPLRMAGFHVAEASSGEDALCIIKRNRPALVLINTDLPDMTRSEFYQRVKADPDTASALIIQPGPRKSLDLTADAYVPDRLQPHEMLLTVIARLQTPPEPAEKLEPVTA